MNRIGDILAATERGTLRLCPMVITDWRDGPIEGIARLSGGGGLWRFKLFAELFHDDDLNERLFLFSLLPDDVVESKISKLIAGRRLPLVWPFTDHPESNDMMSAVDLVMEAALPATLVVNSTDFEVVNKAWVVRSDPT